MAANSVTALRSTNFIDSIGVNTHLQATAAGNAYTGNSKMVSDLTYLGITLVRDAVYPVGTANTLLEAPYTTLAHAGVRFDFCVLSSSDLSVFMAGVNAFAQGNPEAVAAIEGPNEINYFPFHMMAKPVSRRRSHFRPACIVQSMSTPH